jgi:hypothetical protein
MMRVAEALFLLAFIAPPLTVIGMLTLIALTPSRRTAAAPSSSQVAEV